VERSVIPLDELGGGSKRNQKLVIAIRLLQWSVLVSDLMSVTREVDYHDVTRLCFPDELIEGPTDPLDRCILVQEHGYVGPLESLASQGLYKKGRVVYRV
jgi:hypothetical protein